MFHSSELVAMRRAARARWLRAQQQALDEENIRQLHETMPPPPPPPPPRHHLRDVNWYPKIPNHVHPRQKTGIVFLKKVDWCRNLPRLLFILLPVLLSSVFELTYPIACQ